MLTDIKKLIDQEYTPGKILTEPTLLSDCGTRVTLDAKDKYNIEIEPGEYLVISVGFTANKTASRFTHPNIAGTTKIVHEFKHYQKNGGKRWTARAGVDHVLVIPRNQVKLLPEKGYSYIHAEINGVKVSFNVSGGGGGGWTDYLHIFTTISVNHKLADLKKLAAVAVRNSPYEPFTCKPLPPDEEERWNTLAAKATPNVKEKICKMIEEGKRPVVHFLAGYSSDGETKGEAIEVQRRGRKVHIPPEPGYSDAWRYEYTGAPKRIILAMGFGQVRAKITQIDWYKTAKENGLIKEVVKEDPNQLKLNIA